jgi:hypothetical protein
MSSPHIVAIEAIVSSPCIITEEAVMSLPCVITIEAVAQHSDEWLLEGKLVGGDVDKDAVGKAGLEMEGEKIGGMAESGVLWAKCSLEHYHIYWQGG